MYFVLDENNNKLESLTKEEIITAIAEATGHIATDVDDAFITKIKEANKNKNMKLWVGTEAEYRALSIIDTDTFYAVYETTDNDYVIQTGQEGNWHWKKYKNGDIEAYGRFNVSGEPTAAGGLYSIMSTINLPANLFTTANNMVVNVSPLGGNRFGSCYIMTQNAVGVQIFNITNTDTANVGLFVCGR